jgi:hypothetical protein
MDCCDGKIPWFPVAPILAALGLSLWDFIESAVYMSPMGNSIQALRIRISQSVQQVDKGIISRIWREQDNHGTSVVMWTYHK